MKWIIKNWLILAAGLILTALAVRYAYHERGYIAVGSEWTVYRSCFFSGHCAGRLRRRQSGGCRIPGNPGRAGGGWIPAG